MNQLYNSDFSNHLHHCKPVRMIFADPPDAIGLKYNGFKDEFSDGDYRRFMSHMIRQALGKCEVFWLSFNSRHTLMVGAILYNLQYDCQHIEVKPCVQTFTFGQHNHHDLGNNHRPLYRLMHKGTKLYPDQVRVPSWRQLNGDKRADPRGRVPGDVFEFPRVTGNSKQRKVFSPTQLHEGLYERCIKLSCSPGDTVIDLFAGSGTLGRVAEKCGVNAVMLEISGTVCDWIARDQDMLRLGLNAWGKPTGVPTNERC